MLNTITLGDCIAGMQSIDAGSVSLIIADPIYHERSLNRLELTQPNLL